MSKKKKIKLRLFDIYENGNYRIVEENIVCDKIVKVTEEQHNRIQKAIQEYDDVMDMLKNMDGKEGFGI